MTSPLEHYRAALDDGVGEMDGITILIAAGVTQAEVAEALGIRLDATRTEYPDLDDIDWTGYAMTDVPGGVLALEFTGYADPSLTALQALTHGGRAAAVVRDNIQAHLRFGAARNGEIVFDDDEYTWVEPEQVPDELRELFGQAWIDPDIEIGSPEDVNATNGFPIGLAMAEVITGIRIDTDDLQRAQGAGYRPAPSMRYASELS